MRRFLETVRQLNPHNSDFEALGIRASQPFRYSAPKGAHLWVIGLYLNLLCKSLLHNVLGPRLRLAGHL